jgi:hypothetical protein
MRFGFCFVAGGLGVMFFACTGGGDGTAASTGDGGEVADGAENTADASVVVDGGGEKDAATADATPVGPAITLLDSTPATDALHVSVLTPVKLHFSAALKAASVTEASVMLLLPNASVGAPADVTYDDATHTVTLTPKVPLAVNNVYRVRTKSLVGADGAAVTDVAFSFTTLFDSFLDNITYDATGTTVTALTTYDLGTDGRIARRTTWKDGGDNVMPSPDDIPINYYAYTYGTATYRNVYYNGIGADGMWFSPDDVISIVSDYDYTVPGRARYTYTNAPGADGKWFTPDDVIGQFTEIDYNADGREISAINYAGPGVDNKPFTPDDVVQTRFTDEWTGNVGKRIFYGNIGADGVWFTPDDVVSGVSIYTLDATGRLVSLVAMDTGPDNKFLTPDDTPQSVWSMVYDGTTGLITQFRVYTGMGADGMWQTPDDVLDHYFGYTYDAAGAVMTRKIYTIGADAIWFSPDDLVTYAEHMHDTQ